MLLIIISINLILIVAVKKRFKKKKIWLPLNQQVPACHQPLLPAAPQERKKLMKLLKKKKKIEEKFLGGKYENLRDMATDINGGAAIEGCQRNNFS